MKSISETRRPPRFCIKKTFVYITALLYNLWFVYICKICISIVYTISV